MRRTLWMIAAFVFSFLFWMALDATGMRHEPFDYLDRFTGLGLAMWLSAVFSVLSISNSRENP